MTSADESPSTFDRIESALEDDDARSAVAIVESLHPADQADTLERLEPDLRQTLLVTLLATLSMEGMAELLQFVKDEVRTDVVEGASPAVLAQVLDAMSDDEAVDVLRTLSPLDATRVLSEMTTAQDVLPLLEHEDESAGGLMTSGYVALHPEMTVRQTIAFMRLSKPESEVPYYLFVLGPNRHLLGVVDLRQLLISREEQSIADVMSTDVVTVGPEADQEEVARLVQHYRLRALPVVDDAGTLQGVVTADDAMEVAAEEATEDMYRMVGLPGEDYIRSSSLASARRRLPWLSINLVTAFIAAAMVALFEDTIARATALAIFMPIVAGQGGNSGVQSITIVVRSLALGEIYPEDRIRVLTKEVTIGLIKGSSSVCSSGWSLGSGKALPFGASSSVARSSAT